MAMDKDKAAAELRRRADDRLDAQDPEARPAWSENDRQRLVHELEVHQIELEMQNEELRQSRDVMEVLLEKYADLYDFAPVGYFTFDLHGLIREVNLTGAHLLGIERGLLLGRPFSGFIAEPAERAIFAKHLAELVQKQGSQTCEIWLQRKDGTALYAHLQSMVTEAIDGEGGYIRTTIADFTERKRSDAQILHLASFPRLNPNPILEIDYSGRATYANPATIQLLESFGMDEADIAIFIPSDVLGIFASWDRLNAVILYRDIVIKDRHFRETIFLTPQLKNARIYAYDITERVRTDDAFIEKQQELEELNRSLEERIVQAVDELRKKDQMLIIQDRMAVMGEMINNIAHQWRQPLNLLGLVIQQLPLFYDSAEFNREFLEKNTGKAMELIQQMSHTIDDFRNFFRNDKVLVTFGINQVIQQTISLLEKSFNNQQIDIVLQVEGDPTINGYPNEFMQVLLNILMNARDALVENNVEDARITIHAFADGGQAVVTITDNAGGISAGIIDRLFDPYFSTKGPDKGTGIGLFMSKTIIEKNMKGRLTVRNVGCGAEFRIVV